jgi:phospholipid/cholesterol/gamma-HCH transport system permease protein
VRDILMQMDLVGVGSLTVVMLTGFFTGAVLTLQTSKTLSQFGAVGFTGGLVSVSLVRELGPVLAALMVAGRVGSGMASELGSMLVTEQINAMRALGTDPIKKLVVPRVLATIAMLPVLTIVADAIGIVGGLAIAVMVLHITPNLYLSRAWDALKYMDLYGTRTGNARCRQILRQRQACFERRVFPHFQRGNKDHYRCERVRQIHNP